MSTASPVLDLDLDGRPLPDWSYGQLRRRHAVAVVDHLLREQKRFGEGRNAQSSGRCPR
jgi:hypothetical protein